MARKERKIMASYDNLFLIGAPNPGLSLSGSDNKRYNMYTRQKSLGEHGEYVPTDPTTNPDFFTNYRKVTKELGSPARAYKTKGQTLPKVDAETKAIMNKIKLPTYNEALPDSEAERYMTIHNITPRFAEEEFNKNSEEWETDNFYYKLRAAQVLKRLPKEIRDGALNNFNISAYDAKNNLDKIIEEQNKADAYTLQKGTKAVGSLINAISNSFINKLRESDETRQTTSPADPKELAERLGNNNSFRLYSKSDYDENGNLTEEAKSRGPSAWNSETTTPSGKPKEDDSEIIEYTYKPGDTFGQVIKDLGLNTDAGLWGANGDVEYYTKQLEEQLWKSGVWPQGERQNIPIGTTIKLKRRK